MKLIYIANSRIPTEKAHGTQIIKMCESFADKVESLTLLLPTRKNQTANIYQYYNVKNNFQITKLKTFDPQFLLKFPQGLYIKFQTLFFIKSLNKYFKNISFKGDYVLYTRDQYLLPLLFRFSDNVIWEAHDLPKRKNIYVKYWDKCSSIIAITQGLKDDLIKLGISGDKIFVSPDGVDLKNFTFDENKEQGSVKLPKDKKIALYSGHLYSWKGADVFAEAAKFLDKNVAAVFLGGTDRDINSFKEKYNNKDNIIILGRVDREQVSQYLKAADVLVLPNSAKKIISAKYTSPLKLFEYLAAGKPIVASDLPSIREILNEKNAIFFQSDNSELLAKKINNILVDDTLRESIAKQAKIDSLNYSWDKRAENILNFLMS